MCAVGLRVRIDLVEEGGETVYNPRTLGTQATEEDGGGWVSTTARDHQKGCSS